jgi:hypothetical protein
MGERAVYVALANTWDQARLVGCTISGFTWNNGAAVHINRGVLTVEHCTISGNSSTNGNNGSAGIYATWNGSIRLFKSIVWNPGQMAGVHQIYREPGGSVQVSDSIVLGGEHGASSTNPQIVPSTGSLLPSSPAIDFSSSPTASLRLVDIHGETRDASPDIGADEWIDSDADDLPDHWETLHYGNLSADADDDTDSDLLKNRDEYAGGLDPTEADTDGDGISDLQEALGAAQEVYTTANELADDDSDGLTNAQELLSGSDSNLADTNGDGVRDGASWILGINPTSTDSDGDGVTNAAELVNGTNPLLADTDGDGVADGLDPFPLDPAASTLPSSPGDMTAPAVILTKPPGAVLIP